MKTMTLEGLLTDELKDIYGAENQMIQALPKMADAVDSNDLRAAFEKHLEETHRHAERIEQIFAQLEVDPVNKKSVGMEGLVDESKAMIKSGIAPDLMDVALIGIAQHMEHYEIAVYGTARAHARQLGLIHIANLLGQTLEEVKKTDQGLTQLAENRINVQAAMSQGTLVM